MLDALNDFDIIDDEEMIKKSSVGMKISIKYVESLLNKTPKRIVIKNHDKLVAIYDKNDELKCYKAARVWT